MVAFTRYGDQMRRQRKLMQRALGLATIPKYHSLLEMETLWFLKRLLENPKDYISPIKRYTGGLTLLVVYGYQVKSDDDAFLSLADHCVDLLANKICSGGGIWPVDIFPACRLIFADRVLCFHSRLYFDQCEIYRNGYRELGSSRRQGCGELRWRTLWINLMNLLKNRWCGDNHTLSPSCFKG